MEISVRMPFKIQSRKSSEAAIQLFQTNIGLLVLKTLWGIFALDPKKWLVVRLHLRLELLQLLQFDHLVLHPPPPAPHEQVGEESEDKPDNPTDNDNDQEGGVEEADAAPYEEDKVEYEGRQEGSQGLPGIDAIGQAYCHVDRSHK